MKNLFTILGIVLIASIFLVSCGGGNKKEKEKITLADSSKDLKYEGVTLIDGPLSEYVEVVPGKYLFELTESKYTSGYDGTMKVKFKFLESVEVEQGGGYNWYGPSLIGKALDEQGIPLDFKLSVNVDEDLATYLKRGHGEEWLTLNLSAQGIISNQADADNMIEKFKKGRKIRFNSKIVEEKFRSSSSSSSKESSKADNKDISNCDEFLEGYEKFVNEYIAVIKKYKANPTDTSILADYTKMLTNATKWSNFDEECANDPAFIGKFTEIQMKIALAASEM